MFSILFIRFKFKRVIDNRFSPASIYKYKKFYKIKYKFSATKPLFVFSRDLESLFKVRLLSTTTRLFQAKNLKAFKMFVRKPYTKIMSIIVNPYKGFTKKPSEVRMGKGKGGKIAFRAFPMRVGSLIASLPERAYPPLSYPRTYQKFCVYSNKFNSSGSRVFRGFF